MRIRMYNRGNDDMMKGGDTYGMFERMRYELRNELSVYSIRELWRMRNILLSKLQHDMFRNLQRNLQYNLHEGMQSWVYR